MGNTPLTHAIIGDPFPVRDEVELTSPQTFKTALITWGDWKQVSPDEITIHDGDATVRVKFDAKDQPVTLRAEVTFHKFRLTPQSKDTKNLV